MMLSPFDLLVHKHEKPGKLWAHRASVGFAGDCRPPGLRVVVEGTVLAFRPVPAGIADLPAVQDLGQVIEDELDTLSHGNAQRP